MSDLIRRTDAIKAVEALREEPYFQHADDDYWRCGVSDARDAVENVPSADLNAEFAEWAKLWFKKELEADRPQGEWIIHSNGKMCDCSACNESYDRTFEYVDEWNFCPNCGARMKGADDEQ